VAKRRALRYECVQRGSERGPDLHRQGDDQGLQEDGHQGKSIAVTLTLVLKDTAGNTKTVTKTVKLKKRY